MEVKVTQDDREAAAEIVLIREADGGLADLILNGEADRAKTVQIIARHRIALQAELIEALEEMLIEFDVPSYAHRDEVEVCAKARAAITKAKGGE